MKIHIQGWADKLDVCSEFSDNCNLGVDFEYYEESSVVIPGVTAQMFTTTQKTTLKEARDNSIRKILGDLELVGQDYGYSEWTIMGFDISSAQLGGHNLQEIVDNNKGKYIHLLFTKEQK